MNIIDQIYTKNISEFSKKYLVYTKKIIDGIDIDSIENFIQILISARENKATVFFAGNGGSASTASHYANDLAIGTNNNVNPIKALSLTDNNAVITAIANDFGYDQIFLKQLQIYGKSNDVLVVISASGNSPNLISLIDYANANDIITVALTAFDGGQIKRKAKNSIHVPTNLAEYGPAEDAHLIINHLVMSYLKRHFENEEN